MPTDMTKIIVAFRNFESAPKKNLHMTSVKHEEACHIFPTLE